MTLQALSIRRLRIVLAAGLIAASSGCNIVGPIAYLIHGPEKVKKVHGLDKDKTTVIFIDDRANNVPRRALRLAIGEEAEKALLKQKVVKDMVSAQSALAAAGTDRSGKPISNTEIGEAVKAQVVIYATVDKFVLTSDGTTLSPTVAMRIRVIDVASDTRVWPEDPSGFPLTTRLPARTQAVPTSTSQRYQIEDEMARLAGLQLAQLFYAHETPKGIQIPE